MEDLTRPGPRARRIFLDLFSGTSGVGNCIRRQGYAVLSFDIRNGPEFNLCHPVVVNVPLGWITGGVVVGIWLATTCKSWSRARRVPVRTNDCIYGLPNLSVSDSEKVKNGNLT